MRKHRFNKVRQLPTSWGQKGREILLISQFRLRSMGTIPFLYMQRAHEEKETNGLESYLESN